MISWWKQAASQTERGTSMNRDFDEELGRSRQDGRRRESGTPDDRAEYSGGRRGEAGNGEYSRRHSSHRAGYGTAGADYRSEQELWEERKRRQLHQEEAGESEAFSGRAERSSGSEERTGRGRSRAAASRGRGARPETGRKQSSQTRQSARQTAAGADGLSPRVQAQIQKKKRRRRLLIMIAAECIALALIFGYGFVARTMAKIQRPENFNMDSIATNEISEDVAEQMKGYWTIALFGVDSRGNVVTKGTNADVNMICNINRDTGEIRLVSVYRDTYLNVSKEGTYNKLNYAYAVGGPEQAIETLNRNLDLEINDYMTFNWKAVANAIDILGGVDIELSKAEFYYINSFITETVKATGIGSHQLTHAGMNHLDGVQAVAYGRLRLMDTDFARTERQRKIIQQAFEKAKTADFQTLYVLIGTVFPQVSTSIWVDDLVNNAKNISKFHLGETTGFPQARGNANIKKKGDVVVPATLESNVKKLHEFLYGNTDYTPSETVKKISAKIASDTGIYKEGQYVDKVGTDGGVIQPPKTKPAETQKQETESAKETKETKETAEEGYQYVYVKDANGERVRKKVKMETNADGEYVKWETDADGYLTDDRAPSLEPAETDENGNPKESTGRDWIRPTETDADGNIIYPTDADGNYITRPGETLRPGESSSGSGTSLRPGESSSGSGTSSRPGESSSGSGTSLRPGESSSGSGTSSRPGESSSGNGTSSRPGETSSGNGTSSRPGESGSGTIRPTAPESSSGSRPGNVTDAPGAIATTGSPENGGPGSSSSGNSGNTGGPGSSSQNGNPIVSPGSGGGNGSGSSVVPTAGTGVVAGPGQ